MKNGAMMVTDDDVKNDMSKKKFESLVSHRPFPSSDHCSLINKLIKIRMEEEVKIKNANDNYPCQRHHQCNNVRVKSEIDSAVGAFRLGRVKALTTYFDTLPFASKFHQSTPNLFSLTKHKLSCEELARVKGQLEEWSEFGLNNKDNNLVCSFMKRAESAPALCFENEIYDDFKKYRDALNRIDKVKAKRIEESNNRRFAYKSTPKEIKFNAPKSEKHRCRSACYNPKRKSKKNLKLELAENDGNETLVI